MTNSDISLVINSIDSKPMAFEEIYIDRIRKSLIDDIKYTNKMSKVKIKSIDEVNSIKFICVIRKLLTQLLMIKIL
jgi:hypothetical protein